jgi:predicted nucleotidyltransferase component of viral defense system
MMAPGFVDTVRLLLEVLPSVFASNNLALKGGTAINLYLDEMPRLSVDIDAVFVPLGLTRDEAMQGIGHEIARIRTAASRAGLGTRKSASSDSDESQLFVYSKKSQVKIEINTVFRGSLLAPERRSLHLAASEMFGVDVPAWVLNSDEVYAGKMLAALDRQHPRDLFDIWRLYQRGPVSPSVLAAFVVYLCGHRRPPHEILGGPIKVIDERSRASLVGMVRHDVPSQSVLAGVLSQLRADILHGLSASDQEFLKLFFGGTPNWDLIQFGSAHQLPALNWKLINIAKFKTARPIEFSRQFEALSVLLA